MDFLKKILVCFSLTLTSMVCAHPAFAGSGTEAASFLDIPVGARPAALGAAYTSQATDAYAPVWNPAGLGMLQTDELAGQHLSYLESIHYEFLSFVHPLRQGRSLGGSIQYLGSGDIPSTNLAGQSIGSFSSHYAAYTLSAGQALNDRLSLGVSGKIINAKISDVSANAYAVDGGLLWKARSDLTVGASLTNLGTALKFLSSGDPLPMSYHLGATYNAPAHVNVTMEGVYARTGLASGRAGLEWKPYDALALRAGYRTDTLKGLSPIAGLTMGVGIQAFGQEFSYAWVPYGDLGNTQYFSLVLRFGGTPEGGKRNWIHYHPKENPYENAYNAIPDPDAKGVQDLLAESDPQDAPKIRKVENIPSTDNVLDAPLNQPSYQ